MKKEHDNLIFLGLGANLGNRQFTMERAAKLLEKGGFGIEMASAFYETPPWGKEDQPAFLNQVLGGTYEGEPMDLLALAMETETALGRERKAVWGPRTLDIDLLVYGRVKIHAQRLTVPHPYIKERAFVLAPLAELAPNMLLPGEKMTIAELLMALPEEERRGIVKLSDAAG